MTAHRLKHFLERNDGGCWGDDPAGIDDTVVLRSTEQSANGDWRITDPAVRHVSASERKNKTIDLGDIIITKSSGSADHIGKASIADQSVADLEAVYSNFMQRIRVNLHASPRYVWHLLNSSFARYHYNVYATSTSGLGNLNGTIVGNLPFPVTDLATQHEVAHFLDRETARIDLLIEKKQRLVALLGEKLRSAITDALSKGVDRSVPMQSTGLTWLPEVPAHWTVPPLRTLIWYQEGPGILAVDFHDEGIPLLRIKGLSGRYATLDGCNYLDPNKVKTRWKHFRVEVGDYLISASATTGGIATEVTDETAGAVPYTGIIRIKPRRGGYAREIIPLFLLSTLFEEQITLLSAGSTIQHFGPSHLSRMKAPLPPKEEQIQIAKKLSSAMLRTEEATQKINTSIDRLKEYRSALITAAVTGQIDVTTYAKSGTPDRHLDAIQEEMGA